MYVPTQSIVNNNIIYIALNIISFSFKSTRCIKKHFKNVNIKMLYFT